MTSHLPCFLGVYDASDLIGLGISYVPEIAALGFTNIIHIIDHPDHPDTTITVLQEARANNLKVIIDVGWVLFQSVHVYPWVFAADWQARWAARQAIYAPYQDVIYSYYFDEPQARAVEINSFRAVTKYIRENVPGCRIMVFCGRLDSASIPVNYLDLVDDIGFGVYYQTDLVGFADYYNGLEAKARHGQRMWLVPEAFMSDTDYATHNEQLNSSWDFYVAFARMHPRVVGLLPFLYSPWTEFTVTLKNLFDPAHPAYNPTLKQKMIAFGQQVLANAGIPYATSLPLPATATASGTPWTDQYGVVHTPDKVLTGVSSDSWIVDKGFPPQWIQFDLGAIKQVSSMQLTVNQSPSDLAVHVLYGGETLETLVPIRKLQGSYSTGQILDVQFPLPISVRYLKIVTLQPPIPRERWSWVAWGQIMIYGE